MRTRINSGCKDTKKKQYNHYNEDNQKKLSSLAAVHFSIFITPEKNNRGEGLYKNLSKF